jgi:hypothetical protein
MSASCFDLVSMLVCIRTLDLNFNSAHLRALRYVEPSIASKLEGTDRVRDHRAMEAEIILGVHEKRGISKGLLNRVDAEIYTAQLTSQLHGNHGLSGARQPAEDNQHWRIPVLDGWLALPIRLDSIHIVGCSETVTRDCAPSAL